MGTGVRKLPTKAKRVWGEFWVRTIKYNFKSSKKGIIKSLVVQDAAVLGVSTENFGSFRILSSRKSHGWVSPEAGPEIRIWMQGIYLRSDQVRTGRGRETKKEKMRLLMWATVLGTCERRCRTWLWVVLTWGVMERGYLLQIKLKEKKSVWGQMILFRSLMELFEVPNYVPV